MVKTVGKEVSGVHLIATFISRRVHPIQARAHSLFAYAGAADVTRTSAEELSSGEIEARVCSLTLLKVGEANALESPIMPFSLENPVPEVCAFDICAPFFCLLHFTYLLMTESLFAFLLAGFLDFCQPSSSS